MSEFRLEQFNEGYNPPRRPFRDCDTEIGFCGCGGYHGARYSNLIQALNVGDTAFIPSSQVGKWFPSEARKLARKLGIILSIYHRHEVDVDGWRIWRNE